MPKSGNIQDWRVVFHYAGTKVPARDVEGFPTGEMREDTSQPLDKVHACGSLAAAQSFSRVVLTNGGWTEIYFVDPKGSRKRKDWELVEKYDREVMVPAATDVDLRRGGD